MVRSAAAGVVEAPSAPGRLALMIVVGTLPIVVVGVLLTDAVEDARSAGPAVAAGALVVGAVAMLVVERLGRAARGDEHAIRWPRAF